jgi:hypothetical protein
MAITVIEGNAGAGRQLEAEMLTGAQATTGLGVGDWIETTGGYVNYNLHVTGITSATVTLYGSNAAAKPAASAVGVILGTTSTVTHGNIYAIGPWKYIKASVTTYVSGTITARLIGVS